MNNRTLFNTTLTLICSVVLVACGSSSSGMPTIENTASKNKSELEIAQQLANQAKDKQTQAENRLKEAEQKLQTAQNDLQKARQSQTATADELKQAQNDLDKARKDLLTAQNDLKNAQSNAQKELQAAQDKLNAAQKAQDDAVAQAKLAKDQEIQQKQSELEKAQQALQNAKDELDKIQKNQSANTDAQDLQKAKNDLKAAQTKLDEAQNQLNEAKNKQTETSTELAQTKQALDKAKQELEAAKTKHQQELANAKQQAVDEYKKELDKEATRQKDIKTELDKLFVIDNSNELPTKQDDDDYRNPINTNILSIDHAKGKVTSTINPSAVPELYAIKINDTSIPLLKKEFEEDERQNLAFKKFDEQDIPKNAKGWVGSMGVADADKGTPVFNKMRFGVYVDENNVSHLFVHGRTPFAYSISRKDETYAYQGHAIIGKNGEYTPLENAISGEVDFKNKQVNLNLQADKETSYKLNGKINGNAFASEEGADVYTKGGFYGSINNIGGMLQINKGKYAGYDGVYGAGQVKEITK
ncbi:hypothetical protein [Alysiella filiformis]|uniref:Transferrin binding protein-like solute binding protein n=1 Tax=Alysiella filiformis DSM 16848 TaxID=1120981 RepID=A0A286E3Q5_9NEIS|nr:hypothetical protein [Alysiella filiformis]QMT31063.1 hypothetical protein H3L97_10125 [Alysiella filiformis]UBQ55946.1 hypothetical protein JF568_10345 [Alysiella filiformis DSM 16848]SOD65536.1 hypothetical protein SAMN02746062_00324 [Alysiella filiformis DSM 16848]